MNGPLDIDELVESHRVEADAVSHGIARELVGLGLPMWRRTDFDPGHFTASGFVASPTGGSMLLVHHGRLGRWLQPGGHFEVQDTSVEVAARREVGEETGVTRLTRLGTGLVRIDAHPIPARSDEPAHLHIDLGIGFIAESDAIGPIDEVLDARWVPFDELDRYQVDDPVKAGSAFLRTILNQ